MKASEVLLSDAEVAELRAAGLERREGSLGMAPKDCRSIKRIRDLANLIRRI